MVEIFSEKQNGFTWLDVTNPTQEELMEIAGEHAIPRSSVKDSLEPEHLPKFEQIEDKIFIIIRVLDQEARTKAGSIQQASRKIAIFYDKGLLITIHRSEQPLLRDLKTKYVDTGKVQKENEILLHIVYQALKTYEEPATRFAEEMDVYESAIFLRKKVPDILKSVYKVKRRASVCFRIITLMDDVVRRLNELYKKHYLAQDLLDLQLRLSILYNEIVDESNHLLNIYISFTSQRTGEVMRVLTIFSVFFMPLTFIVGIYGMNFDFMPELRWHYGYYFTLAAMLLITAVIYFWFKRKRWL
ncbi:magnesium transporter [Anseongella ginsenosidimutans]|uniref:Magnesium transporter n=1 Tax=Anseongella ginsenosidimutans TaxID=496056 RepID=A0A4R3KQR5_9SPHI|nr:CorA family divalent cation transporter [Anseongella ginsenosidimutans]QEC52403.1 magnesium transporter CorA [Anseongella ginsenosidimutans]TCS85854.1 magnesium transporter [Anseongella ginsenosidimutans]